MDSVNLYPVNVCSYSHAPVRLQLIGCGSCCSFWHHFWQPKYSDSFSFFWWQKTRAGWWKQLSQSSSNKRDDLTSRVRRVLVLSLRVWATRDTWLSAEGERAKTSRGRFPKRKTHLKLHSAYVIKQLPWPPFRPAGPVRCSRLLIGCGALPRCSWRSAECLLIPTLRLRHDETRGRTRCFFSPPQLGKVQQSKKHNNNMIKK